MAKAKAIGLAVISRQAAKPPRKSITDRFFAREKKEVPAKAPRRKENR
jgi:hypothetical protein